MVGCPTLLAKATQSTKTGPIIGGCPTLLKCSCTDRRSSANILNMKASLGLSFLGGLDGNSSTALAYSQAGVLRSVPGTYDQWGSKHTKRRFDHINNYLVFDDYSWQQTP